MRCWWLAAWLAAGLRQPSGQLLLQLALLLLPFSPASHIVFPMGTVLAERLQTAAPATP